MDGTGRDIKRLLLSVAPRANTPNIFTDKAVRVLVLEVSAGGETQLAVVENDGIVRRSDIESVLDPGRLEQLKDLIEKSCGR